MMRKMGWETGKGLGKNEEGRTAPVPLSTHKDRVGLGAECLPEAAKQRPFCDESDSDETSFDPLVAPDGEAPVHSKALNSKPQQVLPPSKKSKLEQQLKGTPPHIRDIIRIG
jgi:hypothetical protein